jgi:hypothetical protein
MNCREFLDAIDDAAPGGTPPPPSDALLAHAAGCPDCAARWEESKHLDARLKALRRSFRPSEGLLERVRSALATPTAAPVPPARIRLWRWAPAAAAALLVAALAVLFLAGPGPAVPSVIADTLSAYEGIASGAQPLDIAARDPKAVQAFFQERLSRDIPTPCIHPNCSCPPDACACSLKGGSVCALPSSGDRVPGVVYETNGALLAMLVVDPARLDPALLGRGERIERGSHTVYVYRHGDVTAVICPVCDPGHVWVSRLAPPEMLNAVHAMSSNRPPGGNR